MMVLLQIILLLKINYKKFNQNSIYLLKIENYLKIKQIKIKYLSGNNLNKMLKTLYLANYPHIKYQS